MKKVLQNIFSIKNDKSHHKIITFLGIKFKFSNKERLIEEHFNNKIVFLENKLQEYLQKLKKVIPSNYIDTIELHIVEHCNLNCKGCSHFAPLAQEEFLNIDDYTKDIKRLYELTHGNIKQFNLLGGEPLLHPQCLEFLRITRKIFPQSIIRLVSNGILLPEQNDNFYRTCNKYNVLIAYSEYPIDIDYNKITEKCKQFDVDVMSYGKRDCFWEDKLNLYGESNVIDNFLECKLGWGYENLFFLKQGKLYTCWKAAYINHFNRYYNKDIPLTQYDYIDIYKVKSIKSVLEFHTKPIPFCAYCEMKTNVRHPWERSEKKISEWINEIPSETPVVVERE